MDTNHTTRHTALVVVTTDIPAFRNIEKTIIAVPRADLEWQLRRVGSAPWESSRLHTSLRDLLAACIRT
jgi:hypothetical protein